MCSNCVDATPYDDEQFAGRAQRRRSKSQNMLKQFLGVAAAISSIARCGNSQSAAFNSFLAIGTAPQQRREMRRQKSIKFGTNFSASSQKLLAVKISINDFPKRNLCVRVCVCVLVKVEHSNEAKISPTTETKGESIKVLLLQ